MRTILHISDLHFGMLDAAILRPLREAAVQVRPDLTVVTGDLTQRARGWQFKEAARFLESIPGPRLVVPGNHDVPLYNVAARFAAPLWGYKRHINPDPEPVYEDEEMVVLGLNSSRSLTIQDGRLNEEQIARMQSVFCGAGGERVRVLASHHPFVVTEESDKEPIENAAEALRAMSACRVDAALTGHLHTSWTHCRAVHSELEGRQEWGTVLIQAGTVSMRARGEAGAFNVVRIERERMSIDRYLWNADGNSFAASLAETFVKGEHGWVCG